MHPDIREPQWRPCRDKIFSRIPLYFNLDIPSSKISCSRVLGPGCLNLPYDSNFPPLCCQPPNSPVTEDTKYTKLFSKSYKMNTHKQSQKGQLGRNQETSLKMFVHDEFQTERLNEEHLRQHGRTGQWEYSYLGPSST